MFLPQNSRGVSLLKIDAVPTLFAHMVSVVTMETRKRPRLDEAMNSQQSTITASQASSTTLTASQPISLSSSKISFKARRALRNRVQTMRRRLNVCQVQLHREREKNKHTTRNLRSFLNNDQIQFLQMSVRSRRGIKWSDETIKACLKIRYACGAKGYSHLRREGFPLPAYRTLCQRVENVQFAPGIHTDVLQWLKVKADKQDDSYNLCTLTFDEMSIKPAFEFDKG